MDIFNSESESTNKSTATTIIAHGTLIKGDIELKSNLYIDGSVEGEIHTTGNVVVGKTGVAKGDVQVHTITVSGQFDGSVVADKVEILEGGILSGKVSSKVFVIEANGIFEGESSLRSAHADVTVEKHNTEAEMNLENSGARLTTA